MSRAVSLVLGIILLILLRQCGPAGTVAVPTPDQESGSPAVTAPEQAVVRIKRVVDGDTLLLEGGERVRLLGVDTPETVKPDTPVQFLGPEASAFTKQMVEGRQVTLVFDKERYDRYHRILAFVYVSETCLNEELIRNGLSFAQLQYPYRSDMKRRFKQAEAEAQAQKRGLWSRTEPSRTDPLPASPFPSSAEIPRIDPPVEAPLRYQ